METIPLGHFYVFISFASGRKRLLADLLLFLLLAFFHPFLQFAFQ